MKPLVESSVEIEVLQPVEVDLLRETGGVSVEWFGRAGTALYRAYLIARLTAGANVGEAEVIIPSISCATPANAALLAGLVPRFADVEPATGMPTLDLIQERWTPQTCAVVFIHLYGQTADLSSLKEWCRVKNIVLIEDVAQALRARLPNGAAAGSGGDLSVYSFNRTKILECGGGALVIRSERLRSAHVVSLAKDPIAAGVDPEKAATLGLSYRNLHHALVGLRRSRSVEDISAPFLNLQPAFQELYLQPMKSASALGNVWPKLTEILQRRYAKAEQYEEVLADGPWQTIQGWKKSGVCWRYSLLFDAPEKLVALCESVRQDGFHVSNLYWPVNEFFRPSDLCPNANAFARQILNLWVDATVDRQWVHRCAKSLRKNADRITA